MSRLGVTAGLYPTYVCLGVPRQGLELVAISHRGIAYAVVRVWLAAEGLLMCRRGYSLQLPMLSMTCPARPHHVLTRALRPPRPPPRHLAPPLGPPASSSRRRPSRWAGCGA